MPRKEPIELAIYAEHGISIRRLLTDNGSCYRSHRFRVACEELGLRHRFTRPYRPVTAAVNRCATQNLRTRGYGLSTHSNERVTAFFQK